MRREVCNVCVVGHGHHGDSSAACTLHTVDVILHEGMIRLRVREIVGAVCRTMVHKKAAAFYTTFIVVEELMF